jgi:hypothetical protein
MVAALADNSTIYRVLASAARFRSPRSLAYQLISCMIVGATILALAPNWWPAAALVGTAATYASWGLLDHFGASASGRSRSVVRHLLMLVAGAGTGFALAGLIGIALAFWAGSGRSPYDACGPNATHARCEAMRRPRTATQLP